MEFKPFDKVMVRDSIDQKWEVNLYSRYDERLRFPHKTIDGMRYKFCKPYNEEEYLNQFKPKYSECQQKWIEENNIKVGSFVKVIRTAEALENGWLNSWENRMNRTIGLIGKVLTIDSTNGITLRFVNTSKGKYAYPYFVLEVVKS